MRRIIGLLLATAGIAAAQNYTISTVAGGGGPAVGGSATATGGYFASGVVATAAGNVYVSLCSSAFNEVVALNPAGVIIAVIGTSVAGFSGDNGPANSAQFNCPGGLALDSSGNLYIADTANYRIRKVTASTGIITTVAGNGSFGYSGDNIAAVSAGLSPSGVAVDGNGNLYIADIDNQRIRKVTASTGIITTVSGNGTAGYNGDNIAAGSAELSSPANVALDGGGNLYIVDTGNARIRRVSALTGSITTAAGSGTLGYNGDNIGSTSAELYPLGIAVDSSGNLYIADNSRIRKVTAQTGIITTVIENGTASYNGDNIAASSAGLSLPVGVALDGAGNLYVADEYNYRVRKVTASTGIISTIAGNGFSGYSGDAGSATTAMPSHPSGVAVDSGGNLYIADAENARIRKVISSTGLITTVAGNGADGYNNDNISATSAKLSLPGSVAVDSNGNLYIADTSNHRIRKVTASTGNITTVAGNGTPGYNGDNIAATSAELYDPLGVALDTGGNLYIADSSNNLIRKVNVSTGIITTVAGNAASRTAEYIDNVIATSGALAFPASVAVDRSGNIYVADSENNLIRKVTASTGMISSVAGNLTAGYNGDNIAATSSELDSPAGIAVDAAGNLYIADSGNVRLRKVTAATGIISTLSGNGTFGFSGDGGLAASATFSTLAGVALDSTGNIYVADAGNNRIRKLTLPAATSSITGLFPDTAVVGGAAFTLNVYGSGFVSGVTVLWKGTPLATVFEDTNGCTASVPANLIATVGTASITVQNPGEAASNSTAFTISSTAAVPNLTGVQSQYHWGATGTFGIKELLMQGSGFQQGMTVSWNGTSIGAVTSIGPFYNGYATVPTGLMQTPGPVTVTATNPGGKVSNILSFTVPALRAMSSISPSTIASGSASFTITVNGAGFVSGDTVVLEPASGFSLATQFINSTQLQATVPAAAVVSNATLQVWVNTAGSNSANFSSTNQLPLTVVTGPALIIAKSHSRNFGQGDSGDIYTIAVTNAGAGVTFGAVTVTDTLPGGLTATAMAGTGWSCTLATLTCTRSDALAAGASYPPIGVTVNVSSSAAANVTNLATVSGGGSSGSSAMDATIIAPAFTLNPSSNPTVPSTAFSGSTVLTVTAGVAWTIPTAGLPVWLTVPAASRSGSGSATINYSVAANTGAARTGSFTILNGSGQAVATFTVTQAAPSCTSLSLSPTNFTIGSAGGSGSFSFNNIPSCSWTASSNQPWVHPAANGNTNTSLALAFTVDANTAGTARTAIITVNGTLVVTVNQTGVVCTYTLPPPPQAFTDGGGSGGTETGSFIVTAPAGCTWTAAPSVTSFVTISPGTGTVSGAAGAVSGNGAGTVKFTVNNPTPGLSASRNAVIGLTGLSAATAVNFVITQSPQQWNFGCSVSAPVVPVIRAEGAAELVGDLLLTCNGNSAGGVIGDVIVTFKTAAGNYPVPVTSHALTTDPSGQTTEALLLKDEPASKSLALNSNVFRALISGPNAIRFPNISLAPESGQISHTFRITNVRVFANPTIPAITPIPAITASVTIASPVPFSTGAGNQTVATVGLVNAFTKSTSSTGPGGSLIQPLIFSEGSSTPYRPKLASNQDPSQPGQSVISESGYVNSAVLGSETGMATSGSRLLAVFQNVPAGVTIYAPVGPASGSNAQLMSADNTGAGGFPVQGSTVIAGVAYQQVILTSNSGTATWEATAATNTLTFNVLIMNPGSVSLAGMQITGSQGPQSPVAAPSATAPVPRFVGGAGITVPSPVILSVAPQLLVPGAQGVAGHASSADFGNQVAAKFTAAAKPRDQGVGGTVTVTEVLSNNSSNTSQPATNVTVGGTLPPTWVITSCNSSDQGVCTVNGNQAGVTYPSLSPGQSPLITLTAFTPGSPCLTQPDKSQVCFVQYESGVVSDSQNDSSSGDFVASFPVNTGPIPTVPTVNIDSPTAGAAVSGMVTVSGSVVSAISTGGTAIQANDVQVMVDGGTVAAATYGVSRTDVCTQFPSAAGCPNVGFTYNLNTANLSPGPHILTVAAVNSDSPIGHIGSTSVNIVVSTCSYSIGSQSASAPAAGGAGSVTVTAPAGCAWTAVSNVAWVTITSGSTGRGNGTVNYSVSANAGGPLSGTLTIAGQTFTITQPSGGCTYTLSPSSNPSVGTDGLNNQSFTVTTGTNCSWTVSMPDWLAPFPLSGVGNGTITYSVYPNFSANARTGSITVGTSNFNVTQGGDTRTSDQRFVRLLYFNFFGRLPSQSELDFQVSQGVVPQGRTQIAFNFFNSAEFNAGGRYVAGLYVGILGRDAEYNGWVFQRNAVAGGFLTQNSALSNFISSTEYQLKYGTLSDSAFVTVLYQNVLLRMPTPSELAFQVGAVQQIGRLQVAQNFLTGAEFQNDAGPRLTAFLLYACLLQRDPSPSDLNFRAGQISSGTTVQSLITAFITSSEFLNVF